MSKRRRIVLAQTIALAACALAHSGVVAQASPARAALSGCPHGGAFLDPVWSPDSKQIAWVQSCKNGPDQIWVASSGGSNPHVLVRDSFVYQLAWSSAAGLLYTDVGSYLLWRVSPTGTRSLVARNFLPSAQGISIDATGGHVAWSSDTCGGCRSPIYVRSLTAGWTRTVGANPKFSEANPTLSPDGQRVAYERRSCPVTLGECRTLAGIWVSPIAGSQAHRVATYGYFPEWSRDGHWIVYDDGKGRLVVIAPNGTRRSVLPGSGGTAKTLAPTFAWSPDSKEIAVWLNGITVFDAATGRGHKVTVSPRGGIAGFSWTPDSKSLFIATGSSCPSLWLIAARGQARHALHTC